MGGGSVPFCASQWHTQNCRKVKTFPAAEQDSYGTLSSLSPFRPPLGARRQALVVLGDTEHRARRLRVRQLFGDGARFFGRAAASAGHYRGRNQTRLGSLAQWSRNDTAPDEVHKLDCRHAHAERMSAECRRLSEARKGGHDNLRERSIARVGGRVSRNSRTTRGPQAVRP